MQLLQTARGIYGNNFVNPHFALGRHLLWQGRKLLGWFPCRLPLGRGYVIVHNRRVANGCGALINCLGYYDPNNMHFLEECVQCGAIRSFYDIGANIGVYTVIAGSAGAERVIAFEPHPGTFQFLEDNIRVNGLQKRVTCVNAALGDRDREVRFGDVVGSATNQVLPIEGGDTSVAVDMRTGDGVVREFGYVPEAVKIDVEGFEASVLDGMKGSLGQVQLLMVECANATVLAEMLCETYGFDGPYKVDFRGHRLLRDFDSSEDWVFIGAGFATKLAGFGYTVG